MKKGKNKKIRNIAIALFLTSSLFIGYKCYGYYKDISYDISKVSRPVRATVILDTDGNKIMEYKTNKNQEWVTIENVPANVKNAFIAMEDKRFYRHGGVDMITTSKALIKNLLGIGSGGGSGITQQLVKNVYLSPEQTFERKFKEFIMANQINRKVSKDKILEAYLNNCYFDEGVYGIKVASKTYFGKDLDRLSLRESATLAAMVNNPSKYNPRKCMYIKKDMEDLNRRVNDVIFAMKEQNYISEGDAEKAYDDALFVKKEKYKKASNPLHKYPEFTNYVISDVITSILSERNLTPSKRNYNKIGEELMRNGYTIHSTINSKIQNDLRESIKEFNFPVLTNGKSPEVSSVVIENSTGNIVGMVGSRKESNTGSVYNRAVYSKPPVASIIKPLTIYAPAYEEGKSPGSLVYNGKEKIEGYDEYDPYPDGKLGPVGIMTYRESLNHSYNIPAARILVNEVGYKKAYSYLNKMGISKSNSDINVNGGGLVLGTSGISMLKMAGAYHTLANKGIYVKPRSFTEVLDENGNVYLKNKKKENKVFSKETSDLITSSLMSVATDGSGYNALVQGQETAVKTGTHNDKSITFAGYTPYYTSTLWIGDDNYKSFYGEPLSQDTAAYLWGNYMNKIHYNLPEKRFMFEDSILNVKLSNITGEIALKSNILYGTHDDYINSKKSPESFRGEKIIKGKKYIEIRKNDSLYKVNHSVLREQYNRLVFDEK